MTADPEPWPEPMEAVPGPTRPGPAEPPFGVVVSGGSDRLVLVLRGELDLCAVPAFERIIAGLTEIGVRRVVLDLAGVTFADVAGVRALVASRARLVAGGGDLVVRSANRSIERLLVLLGQAIPSEPAPRGRSSRSRRDLTRPGQRARAAG